MAKVTRHRFKNTYYEAGLPRYHAGKQYPPDAVTKAEVLSGNAEEVEVEAEKEATDDADPKGAGAKKPASPSKAE
jgi:hypothetical protein